MNLISLMGLDIPGPLRNVRNEWPRELPVESQRCVEKSGDEAADQTLLVGDQTEQRAPLGTDFEKAPSISPVFSFGGHSLVFCNTIGACDCWSAPSCNANKYFDCGV